MDDSQAGDGPPRAALIAALVVAVVAVLAVLVVAAVSQRTPAQEAVAITGVPAPQAASPDCRALVEALPEQLGDYRRVPLVDPAPAGTAAWRTDGGEAVILRCGLDRPAEFVAGAPLQVVDAVSWFRVGDVTEPDRSTWFAVDRPVYVALTLPPGAGPAPIQALSKAIADTLERRRPEPAPIG
ncbi:DUF3515 domain-containing protein [Mycolicibacterium parafortuitum]|uniref:DUF3515 domain-containing protein n=1 Tax=Mycolicibacterium parafortuitum TaxID=39692 RepID=A0A375YJB6_MYCPF|nr:DUF3515 domain-containing protein [Mycolicibacterium parafortuitum]ORB32480.1 hypothetical protein BST38_02025 [Mycolicibacterium parafortuitum]SRX81210.1 hypothetical protein MPP7335_02959 [Mycolicibacterium parafortuitum]